MKGYNLLWITSILLSIMYLRQADSFQCYECENCPTIGLDEMKYIKECRLPESSSQRPTAAPMVSDEQEDSEGEEDESTEKEENIFSPSSKDLTKSTPIATFTSKNTTSSSDLSDQGSGDSQSINASTENTNEEKKKGDIWSLFPHSVEEEDLVDSRPIDDILNEERKARAEQDLPGTRPMCYVLKINYDGFEVTNRGCGAAVNDKNITCKMLAKGQSYADCMICDGNMCNSAARLKLVITGTLYVLVMIAVYSW